MKIAVDIDGPVALFDKTYLSYCNMRFGYDMDWKKMDEYLSTQCTGFPIQPHEDNLAFEEFCRIRMFAALEATEGAKEGLCSLSGMGCEIIYITARPQSAHRTTAKWLVKMGLPLDGLLFTDKNKGKLAKLLECDLAIDDKPENVEDFVSNNVKTIVWARDYNRDVKIDNKKIWRFGSWKEIVRFVECFDSEYEVKKYE